MTPAERLKLTNPKLYYLILDFKDKNFEEFFEIVGQSSLRKCSETELFKATCLYASKLTEKFPTEGA